MDDFHPAVELALSRMDSNPSEFTYEGGKWRHMLEQHTRWMSKEEKDAINEKLRNINLDNMRKTMTRKILSDGAISPVESTALPVGASWITAPASIAMGSETLTEEDITGLKQMMEEFREERK
jgi:hypothetical protein